MNYEETAVAAVLLGYERALNASDTPAVLDLYTPDGVFMPQHSPSSVGTDAIREAYDNVFRSMRLGVKFVTAKIRIVAPGWAFARTNSSGTVTILSTGTLRAEANQELFVLQKLDDVWKIARYCFSTTRAQR